jgi:hypothetical protein
LDQICDAVMSFLCRNQWCFAQPLHPALALTSLKTRPLGHSCAMTGTAQNPQSTQSCALGTRTWPRRTARCASVPCSPESFFDHAKTSAITLLAARRPSSPPRRGSHAPRTNHSSAAPLWRSITFRCPNVIEGDLPLQGVMSPPARVEAATEAVMATALDVMNAP